MTRVQYRNNKKASGFQLKHLFFTDTKSFSYCSCTEYGKNGEQMPNIKTALRPT